MPPWSRDLASRAARYVHRQYGFLRDDPRFFAMKTLARFSAVRTLVARSRTPAAIETSTASSPHVVCPVTPEGVLERLRSDGYFVGLRLAPALLRSLLAHAAATPCFANRSPDQPFLIGERSALERTLGRSVRVASYFDQQESWEPFRALRSDPWLLAIARAYLGGEPVYQRSELAWSFPADPTPHERMTAAQVLHCDINDYRSLKLFFYLTDVGPHDGPHGFVPGSAHDRTWGDQLLGQRICMIPESKLVARYGPERVVTGPAGTGFFGDPYVLHRGATPRRSSRLLLQLELGLRRYRTWYYDVGPTRPVGVERSNAIALSAAA